MTTATQERITFITPRHDQRLVIEPEHYEKRDAANRVLVAGIRGRAIQFEGGEVTLSPDEITESCSACDGAGTIACAVCKGNGLVVLKDGSKECNACDGEGVNECQSCRGEGKLTRSAARANGTVVDLPYRQVLEWLRNHKLFNNKEGGFYELGNAPDEPRPTIAEQIDAIAEASATGDAALLGALLKQEEKTHNRPPIVVSARKALARIQGDTVSEAEADDAGETAEAEGETK